MNLIDNLGALEDFCQKIESAPVLAIDTEFKRETTYYPIPCLIQIASDKFSAAIDVIKLDQLEPLKKILSNASSVKVVHSCSQDLEIFYRLFSFIPPNLFDTQIAVEVLGTRPQVSYKELVEQYTGHSLDKTETRSDWSIRPLSNRQIQYALDDVVFLLECYYVIIQQLEQANRLDWLVDDFKQLSQNPDFEIDQSTLWKKVKGHHHLNNQQKDLLNQIANWREKIAQQANRPRRRITHDDCLIHCVQHASDDLLKSKCLLNKRSQQQKDNLEQVIANNPYPATIKNYQTIKLNKTEKKTFDAVRAKINKLSDELQLDLSQFIANKEIKQLIKETESCLQKKKLKILNGWRNHAVTGQILPIIQK